MISKPEWCTCEHSGGAHEFGLCQVVVSDYPRRHCPCRDPHWDDED